MRNLYLEVVSILYPRFFDELDPDSQMAFIRVGIIFRPCPICNHIVGGKGGQTAHMIYCSNACRQKAYRLRNGQRYAHPGRPRHDKS